MDIKPIDRTVKNVLEGAFYRIPRFQRPYSWDKENVDDFWTDAITTNTLTISSAHLSSTKKRRTAMYSWWSMVSSV
jgi:uncharacterized protein with ParB-like and HNH nuclease domain